MSRIKNNILEMIGHTPLVRLKNNKSHKSEIIAKVESFNAGGSIKDRIALGMISDAEKRGILKPGGLIIEPTSGNTGVGLALVSAVKGYHLVLTMPDTMSMERRAILKAYGAELVLTPGSKGMAGAIAKAEELAASKPEAFMPSQFSNTANPETHRQSTALEILQDTDGKLDIFVAGVGTGGTITGVGDVLKKEIPHLKIFAVEPEASPVLSGGKPGPHEIQGIGAGFVPEILNNSVYDGVIQISRDAAVRGAKKLASEDGMLSGISSGAAYAAAEQLALAEQDRELRILTVLPDTGERYLSMGFFNS